MGHGKTRLVKQQIFDAFKQSLDRVQRQLWGQGRTTMLNYIKHSDDQTQKFGRWDDQTQKFGR
jgi:hypothetical protein